MFEPVQGWQSVSDPPDDELTVMLYDAAASEPVWPGYIDGGVWFYNDGLMATPTHWMHFQDGPK